MKIQLQNIPKLCLTGTFFALFGFGGILLSWLVFPVVKLVTADKLKRKYRSQQIIHRCFRFFLWVLQCFNVTRINIDGIEKLNSIRNCLIVANHPTLIDVVVLFSLIPKIDCIVKQALYNNFFLKEAVRAAGYIPNKNPEELIETCVKRLQDGEKLLVFPEGTRSLPDRMRKFHRGAALIAINSGCEILPIVIKCSTPFLEKGKKWYDIPSECPEISVDVGDAMDISKIIADCRNEHVAARKLTRTLEGYFEKRLYNRISD